MNIVALRALVVTYFQSHQRDLPWRAIEDDAINPYHVLVSELMLQQTQVSRVIPKFSTFIERFPTVESLADASMAAVLSEWSGLGYNRRAKFLHQAAGMVRDTFNSQIPDSIEALVTLPGVGYNTAGAVYVYSFNKPAIFIETNIRTVLIHHCFADRTEVADQELIPLMKELLMIADGVDPRHWYWALMDYGSYLKASTGNASKRSKHYARQSQFEGSRRQVRGAVLRLLVDGPMAAKALNVAVTYPGLTSVLEDLVREGLIEQKNGHFGLPGSAILAE